MTRVVELFLEFSQLTFIAFGGGTALLPELHRVVVEQHHWLDDARFTQLYAIAQAAPGPNILVATLIGWQIAGLAGALAATLAMCLPMSVVIYLLVDHWHRFSGTRWQRAVNLAVAPLSVGLILAGASLITQAAKLSAAAWWLLLIIVVIQVKTRIHPLWMIAGGALAGLLGIV